MQLNRDYEAEINLKDLFFYVLYRWRSILLFALIGTLVLGGYKYYTMSKPADKQVEIDEQRYNWLLDEKENQIGELETYLNESAYVQLNYQGVWTATCKYLVKPDASLLETLPLGSAVDPADNILPIYSYPLSEVPAEELKEVFNTDKTEYISEIARATVDTNTNTITVTVKGATKDTVEKQLAFVREKLEALQTKGQEIGAHQLVYVGSELLLSSDGGLNNRKTNLTSAVEQIQKGLAEDKQTAAKLGDKQKIDVKELIKFGLIGFFLGAFLTAAVYAVLYIVRGKLRDSSTLSEQYGLPLFGEFKKSGSLHHNKGLDKLIAKWEMSKDRTDPDTVYNNICALISERQTDGVLLVSTLADNKLNPVREAVASRMEGKTVEAEGSFLRNSKAIRDAAKAPAVILVEEKNTSRTHEIDRMVETLMISQANVIGAIVL